MQESDLHNSTMKRILSAMLFAGLASFAAAQRTAPQSYTETTIPIVLGESRTFRSTILSEDRTLNIYLPPSYADSSAKRYPVIYVLDGGLDEDFIHIAGLVQYNTFPWIMQIPESIVVGIANVNRRRDFTTPSPRATDQKLLPAAGGANKFISFLEAEVLPLVEKSYRAAPERTIIGQSLGGLLATQVLLQKPAMFSNYIIISPSLWWNGGALLKAKSAILDSAWTIPLNIYIGVGKEGLTPDSPPRMMEVDAGALAARLQSGGSKALRIVFDYLPEETHATVTHNAVMRAFRLLWKAAP